jgi:hypothetical protein
MTTLARGVVVEATIVACLQLVLITLSIYLLVLIWFILQEYPENVDFPLKLGIFDIFHFHLNDVIARFE